MDSKKPLIGIKVKSPNSLYLQLKLEFLDVRFTPPIELLSNIISQCLQYEISTKN
jgi:hypothetical protein